MRGLSNLAALAALLLVPLLASSTGIAAVAPELSGAAPQPRPAALHRWGGTLVRSLDPSPSRGRAAGLLAAASSPAAPPAKRRADEVLSNETTFTRWAYVAQIAPIYQYPAAASRPITKLQLYTESGFREIYLLLRAHRDAQGQEWVQLRIPMRPNGHTGWVRASALGGFHLTHLAVLINREQLRIFLYSDGHLQWSAPVGVGKPSTPTPAGRFWITERFKIEDPASGYWPYAFGTSDYSTLPEWPEGGVVGIHGPYFAEPQIPGYISHGCVRLHVSDDFWFADHVRLGTPVHIV